MGYWQWGPSDAQSVVLCVHGLTRQGRDFDVLAQALLQAALAQGRSLRLICPDVVGRGRSDWLADPALYQPLTYLADMQALLAHLHAQAPIATLDWLGTSMGGIIGMLAAAQPQALAQPIRRRLLNDVGPQRISWMGQLMTNWMGDDGFLRQLNASVRRPNIFGDVSWCRARIADKRIEEGAHLVDLELQVDNQLGETTARGTAVVELPSRLQAARPPGFAPARP